jgi:16S rRNA (cytidine1402-2'-O)-methyltransferase
MNTVKKHTYGTLFIVATPIGNLEDITLRALKILQQVSVVACEDTRKTGRMLQKYKIKQKLFSYYQPKEKQRLPQILDMLRGGGDVALVSDAGTPGLSDPGYPLIKKALSEGIRVVPIPGPAAVTAALSAAGLPTSRFLFLGFPPPKKTAVEKLLKSLIEESATLVFYIPVRKIPAILEIVNNTMGDRTVVIARELTKLHEEFLRGQPQQILLRLNSTTLKGEATLLIEGKQRKS